MAPSRGMMRFNRLGFSVGSGTRPQLRAPRTLSQLNAVNKRHFSGIETAVESTHALISGIHSFSGLPWYAVLPLTALGIRSFIVFPLSLISQKNRAQRAQLTPQVLEARPQLEREVISKYNHLGPEICTAHLARSLLRKREELRKAAGIGAWQLWAPWAQMPVFLLAIETIRRMCGAGVGALGSIFGRDSAESLATFPADSGEVEQGMQVAAGSTELSSGLHYNPLFEPSLASEGVMWFPNLLVPDPMMILPVTLSSLLYWGVRSEEKLAEAAGVVRPRWSRILTNSLKLVSLAIFPLTINLPAGLLLYWTSSAAFARLSKPIADMIYPIQRSFAPPVNVERTPVAGSKPSSPVKKPYQPIRSRKR